MDYTRLCQLRDELLRKMDKIPKAALESFDKSFDVEYAHHSTAIEGNSLSLIETKAVLEEYAVNGNIQPFAEMIATLESAKLEDYLTLVPQDGER